MKPTSLFSALPTLSRTTATAVAIALSMSACKVTTSKARPGSEETSGEKFKGTGELELSEDPVEALVNEGELLLAPPTMHEAYAKFQQATKLDKDNQRARFWIAMVKPVLEMRGVLARIEPAFDSVEGGKERYKELVRNLRSRHSADFHRFLLEGPKDIRTADEVQSWLDRINASFYETRNVIRDLREADITVNVPRHMMEGSFVYNTAGAGQCGEIRFGPVRYATADDTCDPSKPLPIGLARADFEALLYGLSMFQIYGEIWTAYRIDPNAAMRLVNSRVTNRAEAEASIADLVRAESFGKKRHDKPFSGLKELTADAIAGLQYVIKNQDKLCNERFYSPNNRKGYLISFGVCVQVGANESNEERTLTALENFLAGQSVEIKPVGLADDPNAAVLAKITPIKLIDQPIDDLKDLLPIKFNECRQLSSVNEAPIRHIFSEGSLQNILDDGNWRCKVAIENGHRFYARRGGR